MAEAMCFAGLPEVHLRSELAALPLEKQQASSVA